MLNRLLIPLKGSEPAEDVASLLQFVRRFSSNYILFLHAGAKSKNKSRLFKPYLDLAAGLNIKHELHLQKGHIASVICAAAGEKNIDMICFPWRGKTVLQRTLLGSVSQDVIRLSVKPVFIFKRKLQYFSQGVQLNSIMYATAFKSIDSKVMPYLAYEGLRAEKLVIMNVGARAPDPAAEKKRVAAVQQDLDRLKSECQSGYKKTETVIAIGSARRKIVKQARKLDVDLIVTGKNDRAGGKDAVLGSTAEYIPHHAACSVMIIPGG